MAGMAESLSGGGMTLNLAGSAGVEQPSRRGGAGAGRRRRRSTPRTSHWILGFEEITRRARERFERRDWRAPRTMRRPGSRSTGSISTPPSPTCATSSTTRSWSARSGPRSRPGTPKGSPAGPTPSSPRRSSTRSPGGSSARSASTPRSSISTPHRLPAPRSTSELLERHSAGVVDADLARRILQAYSWSVPYAQLDRDAEQVAGHRARAPRRGCGAGPVAVEMLRPVFFRNKGAYLVGRITPGRAGLPPGPAADPRRARHRGGCGAHDRERGQRRLRLQLVVLPGGGAPAPGAWWSSSARSCRSSGSTSCTTPSASTSTARPSCTAA